MLDERIGHLGAVFYHFGFFVLPTFLKGGITAPYMRDKVKLHFLECFSQEMLDEPIGHLGAVFYHFGFFVLSTFLKGGITAPYMRDKVKLHFLECFSQEMLDEPIGHLGAVFYHFGFFVLSMSTFLKGGITAPYMRDKHTPDVSFSFLQLHKMTSCLMSFTYCHGTRLFKLTTFKSMRTPRMKRATTWRI
jgi:hypothetical protein